MKCRVARFVLRSMSANKIAGERNTRVLWKGGAVMQENSEEWMQLCEQAAASEQDPEQLMTLVEQISVLIEAREQRLREGPSRPTAEAPKGSWPPLPH